MAIHHDKKAYGKLAPSQENVSEERLLEMLKKLKGEAATENGEEDGTGDKASDKNKIPHGND